MKKQHFLWLVFFILTAEAAGLVSSFFIGSIDSWYATLVRPSFSPPNWLFGPVWTTLYALMGTAAYLVWQWGKRSKVALRIYWAQLAVNAVWTPLFFGLHNPTLALADIVLLLALIITTIAFFAKVRLTAVLLLLPYLVWVSFAAVLNFAIWYLN